MESHAPPTPAKCGALARDFSIFRLLLLTQYARILTVTDASISEQGPSARNKSDILICKIALHNGEFGSFRRQHRSNAPQFSGLMGVRCFPLTIVPFQKRYSDHHPSLKYTINQLTIFFWLLC